MPHSVAGGWLGTYYYNDPTLHEERTRFEATIDARDEKEQFTGTILDDEPLGEARLEGRQSGDQATFTKVYLCPSRGYHSAPVEYEGALSEDGKRLHGRWKFPGRSRYHGTWEARRLWHEEADVEAQTPGYELALAVR